MTALTILAAGHLMARQSAPKTPVDPAIVYMGRLVGNWDAVAHVGKQSFKCKFTFGWNSDHRGMFGESTLGVDTPSPMHSHSLFGNDPVAKAAYYVDAHDSDTLYVGHVYLENQKLIFKFGNYGQGEKQFVSTEWFTDNDHYVGEIRQTGHLADPPMVRVELTRSTGT